MGARRSGAPSGAAARPASPAAILLALGMLCAAAAGPGLAPAQGFGDGAFVAADGGEAQAAIQRIAESGRFQMELPPPPPPEEPDPPRDPISPFELSETARTVLIALVALVVLIIIAQLARRRIAPTEKGATRPGVRVTTAPEAEPSAEELRDAETAALAAAGAGRWDEAIHLLLLGAIGKLRERDARATARSLTSREILARHFLGPDRAEARAALAALVTSVEISRFGGQPADESGFQRCLEAYRALRRVLTQRPERVAA